MYQRAHFAQQSQSTVKLPQSGKPSFDYTDYPRISKRFPCGAPDCLSGILKETKAHDKPHCTV